MPFRRFLNLLLGIVCLFTLLFGAIITSSANAYSIELKLPKSRVALDSPNAYSRKATHLFQYKGTLVKLPIS